jgi:dTDP-4-dehydrorhamnose 3,5-epimerase
VKVVRCVRGSLWDVIVDLRPDSPTFMKWFGAELSAENRVMMYVPRGFAHALITLTDDAEAIYLVSTFYDPQAERGVRWNDPAIGVEWPIEPTEVSPKDAKWPDFDPAFHGIEAMRGL